MVKLGSNRSLVASQQQAHALKLANPALHGPPKSKGQVDLHGKPAKTFTQNQFTKPGSAVWFLSATLAIGPDRDSRMQANGDFSPDYAGRFDSAPKG